MGGSKQECDIYQFASCVPVLVRGTKISYIIEYKALKCTLSFCQTGALKAEAVTLCNATSKKAALK
jgi:hypothetical protein